MKRLIIILSLALIGAAQAAAPEPEQVAAIYALASSYADSGARPDQICVTLSMATGYNYKIVREFGASNYQIVLFDKAGYAATFLLTIGNFVEK